MGKRVSSKHKRMAAPDWVFIWRRPKASIGRQMAATLIVAGAFAIFLTFIHIRVASPVPWASQRAAVIQVTADAVGGALTLRAREGGPFPSRFAPAEWVGASALEQAALDGARWRPPAYVPMLRELPDERAPRLGLAAKGEATLPKLRPGPLAVAPAVQLRLAPRLYPLSGITVAAMPRELPPFADPVDAALTAAPWRFLVRLNAAGNVLDCVSLAGGDDLGLAPLEVWLRHVSFNPAPDAPSRWMAVGVGFTNQPADGPDAH